MSERPLKVLSVCTSLDGGAGRAAYRIHQAVRSLGVDSSMLIKSGQCIDTNVISLDQFVPNNPFNKVFDWIGTKIKNKVQHFQWNCYPQRDNVFMSDLRSVNIHGALKRLDFDVLHLHWVNLRFLPLDELPKDKPIIWTLHDSWPFCGVCHYFLDCEKYKRHCGRCPYLHSDSLSDLSYQIWEKKAGIYKVLDLHVVTPSRWLGDCAEQSSLLGRFPVKVIPNCLDVDVFRPLAKTDIVSRWETLMELKKSKAILLYGAMNAVKDKVKGFPSLLSALEVLEGKGYSNSFELVVFGANESEIKMNLCTPVHYIGYVNNVQELISLYNLADVMIVPSLSEVFGQTASEAMACGTPVVAFHCTGLQEVVDHKVNGYLARPYESEDLANGILWCFNHNKENCLGNAAREKVVRNYAMSVVGRKYKELYESVASPFVL